MSADGFDWRGGGKLLGDAPDVIYSKIPPTLLYLSLQTEFYDLLARPLRISPLRNRKTKTNYHEEDSQL
jgi:hypothetical protein